MATENKHDKEPIRRPNQTSNWDTRQQRITDVRIGGRRCVTIEKTDKDTRTTA